MHSTNHFSTLILPAEDCRTRAQRPERPGTVAALQFALIAGAPYRYTSDELIGTVEAQRAGVPPEATAAFIAEYFSRGRPCLRASPLTRTHGWAVHADAAGRVALLDPDSPACAALCADPTQRKLQALRKTRA